MTMETIVVFFIVLLFVFAAAMLFVMNYFSKANAKSKSLPYQKTNLLTPAEARFYLLLAQIVDHNYSIFSQVRLANIVTLPTDPVGRLWEMFNMVGNKCVDFVIWNKRTGETVLVIELDDSSHLQKDRKERDMFVDRVLGGAGVPILHQRCQANYNLQELRQAILDKLILLVEP